MAHPALAKRVCRRNRCSVSDSASREWRGLAAGLPGCHFGCPAPDADVVQALLGEFGKRWLKAADPAAVYGHGTLRLHSGESHEGYFRDGLRAGPGLWQSLESGMTRRPFCADGGGAPTDGGGDGDGGGGGDGGEDGGDGQSIRMAKQYSPRMTKHLNSTN